MELVDTHAHLEEVVDLDAALARAKQAGVIAIIAVGSDLASNQRVLEIARKYPEFVYPALGLHPGSLGDDSHREATFQLMESNLGRAVAIGEIGLDYHYPEARLDGGVKPAQRQAFCRALSLARDSGKPALIHSRGAWQDCLALAQEMKVEKAVFHWFSGPPEVLKQVVAEGYFISATPAAQYSRPHRQALAQASVERLLLETDSPVVYRGEAAEPAHVLKTLKAVSEIKGIAPDLLARATTANAVGLFKLRID